jgi:outer membrane protein
MLPIKTAACAAVALGAMAATAHAEDAGKWFVHLGPAYVDPIERGTIYAGGALYPGADVAISGRATVEGEIGYYVTRHIALAAAGGFPPTFEVKGAGSLAGVSAGKITGGPAGVFLEYHPVRTGRIQPYAGAGAAFLLVFGTKDGALSGLTAKSSAGPAIGGGVDLMVNSKWGAFVDVKKAWLGTIARGSLGGAPVKADVRVDPMVYNVGVAYHF